MESIASRPRRRNNSDLPLFDWADRQPRFRLLKPSPMARNCAMRWGTNSHYTGAVLSALGFDAEVWND